MISPDSPGGNATHPRGVRLKTHYLRCRVCPIDLPVHANVGSSQTFEQGALCSCYERAWPNVTPATLSDLHGLEAAHYLDAQRAEILYAS